MTQTPVPLTSDGPRCTRTGPEEGHWQGDSGGPTRGPPGPPTGRPFCSAQPVSPSFFCLCAPPPPACLSQWVRPGSCPQCPGYSAHGGPPRMAGSQRLPLRGGPSPVLLPPTSLGAGCRAPARPVLTPHPLASPPLPQLPAAPLSRATGCWLSAGMWRNEGVGDAEAPVGPPCAHAGWGWGWGGLAVL